MEKFSIHRIINHFGLDIKNLAEILYPNVKYPKQAFDRVLRGESELDVRQLEELAKHLGIFIQDLFTVDSWKALSEEGCLTITKKGYKVRFNYNCALATVYDKNNKVIEQQFSDAAKMPVRDFLTFLDNFINNYENGNN